MLIDIVDADSLYSIEGIPKQVLDLRQDAVNDLETFIRLVAPFQVISHCHRDLCKWIMENNNENKLLLWPRDHNKSRYAAFYTLWSIVRNPAITIIYASVTTTKASEMLQFVQNIIDSKVFQRYFPNLCHKERNKRYKWTSEVISVDHPLRKKQGVVDPTVFTAGIGTKITGKHADLIVLDDIVVMENTVSAGDTGRRAVQQWIAQVSSIASSSGTSTRLVVGTRYHPKDAYSLMITTEYDIFDKNGIKINSESLYKVNQANVELDGEFLWPRQRGHDGRFYGFDKNIMSRKRAEYTANNEVTQYYAQYYNDPNSRETAPIARELFKYYDTRVLEDKNSFFYMHGKILYVYASVDLAASTRKTSDYTAIAIIGITEDSQRYILHLDRFRTDKTSVINDKLIAAYQRYNYRRLRLEAVAGFKLVANDIKINLEEVGVTCPIELYVPPSNQAKLLRINGILEPIYNVGSLWHTKGGMCELLENELVALNAEHDDLKDVVASCCDKTFMKRPITPRRMQSRRNVVQFNRRFGGVR